MDNTPQALSSAIDRCQHLVGNRMVTLSMEYSMKAATVCWTAAFIVLKIHTFPSSQDQLVRHISFAPNFP